MSHCCHSDDMLGLYGWSQRCTQGMKWRPAFLVPPQASKQSHPTPVSRTHQRSCIWTWWLPHISLSLWTTGRFVPLWWAHHRHKPDIHSRRAIWEETPNYGTQNWVPSLTGKTVGRPSVVSKSRFTEMDAVSLQITYLTAWMKRFIFLPHLSSRRW